MNSAFNHYKTCDGRDVYVQAEAGSAVVVGESYVAQQEELGLEIKPLHRLLDAVAEEHKPALWALLGVYEAADELGSKIVLPADKLAVQRFKRAMIKAEVALSESDILEAEQFWYGLSDDLKPLRGHAWEQIDGPVDQESCTFCLVMRHWSHGADGAREAARYSLNAATYFDMPPFERTDEPPCGDEARISAWLSEGHS